MTQSNRLGYLRQSKEVSFDGASTSAKASDVSNNKYIYIFIYFYIIIILNLLYNSKLRTIELYGK